jgi:hypothetical protein
MKNDCSAVFAHSLSLRFVAFKVPIIIARTLWAFPSIQSHFLLDMYLIAVLMTITMVLIYKGILKVNTKLRVSQHFKQAAMTLCMWIKSHIKADKASADSK